MAAGNKVRGEDMCEAMAERSTGPSKYLCAGLFVGRCRLVRQMFNHVDDVVKQDLLNVENPFFDQALYQIMMLRYPELNLQGRQRPLRALLTNSRRCCACSAGDRRRSLPFAFGF